MSRARRLVGRFGWAALGVVLGQPAWAGEADVVAARAECTRDRVCTFSVTLKHADTGWAHYADRFEILGPEDVVLATRVLRHPHVHEQPFTRKLSGVEIPKGIERVRVRAHDSVDGYGGEQREVTLSFTGEPRFPEAAASPADPQP